MFKLTIKLLVLLAIVLTGGIFQLQAAVHQYTIEIDKDLKTAEVKICFDGRPSSSLVVESKYGNRDLIRFPHSVQGNVEIQGRYWMTKNLPKNACLDYQVSIKRHKAKRSKLSSEKINVSYIEDNTWLWLPEKLNKSDDVELSFIVPSTIEISTPWHQINSIEKRFLLGHQPHDWGYSLLLGEFDLDQYSISEDSVLNIASIRGMKNKKKLHRWLQETANALKNYLGEYPVRDTQVIVVPKTKKKNGPVPWGRVLRGGGMGILFVVIPELPMTDFYSDWTATHEFSHMIIPNIEWENKWLSEGLASYLEYVLMAQSKWISKEEAWTGIYEGLQRGAAGTKKLGESLRATAQNRGHSYRRGSTMRIYWSGALYFVKADLALRQRSNNKIGLNDILLKLNQCCVDHSKMWSGGFLSRKLDDLSDSTIFSELYKTFWNSSDYPEFETTIKQLGIWVDSKNPEELTLTKDSIAGLIMELR